MSASVSDIIRQEKRRQAALIGAVVIGAAIMTFAPQNERRMFIMPTMPAGMAVMEAPSPTTLVSPVYGYLSDFGDFRGLGLGPRPGSRANGLGSAPQPGRMAAIPTAPIEGEAAPADPGLFFANPVPNPADPTLANVANPIGNPVLVNNPIAPSGPGVPGFPSFPGTPDFPDETTVVVPGPSIPIPIPEPGTWMMMILGFGVVGAAMRRSVRRAAPLACSEAGATRS